MRVAVATLVAAVASLVVLGSAASGARTASCRTRDTSRDVEAVFGHFPSRVDAEQFRAIAEHRGFKGFTIENDGCGDFELQSDAITQAQRTAFAREAEISKIQVTWELPAPPDRRRPGKVVAVFGTRSTIAAANTLAWQVAGYGFRYIDIAYAPGAWRVVQPGIPVAQEAAFRAEVARSKHLTVTFATH
jgi:hypothetical protein